MSRWKVTGGADFYAKPTLLISMRKGSVLVRRVAPKSSYAMLVVDGMRCETLLHWSQNITDYSARGKVRGVLYFVFQKSMKQSR